MARRNYILETITTVFRLCGFQQIETPAMENISTLTGKYGEEGDQLLYKILNSRIHESRNKEQLAATFSQALEKNLNSEMITERALRYDLTVPFARYVVMHQNEITFPFKRYQVQPVWRADRPQKGRYREFYQCDADIIGSVSILNEAELVQMIAMAFKRLGVGVKIKINNRKILTAFAEINGHLDKIVKLTEAIDKIEKIGIEKVKDELQLEGFARIDLAWINEIASVKGNNQKTIETLKNYFFDSEYGKSGLSEIESIFDYLKVINFDFSILEIDVTLARGLNYYTGAIFEVKTDDPKSTFTGSILGGGRYDDLTGIFGLPGVSGVGISFGIDRIYDVMDELGLFDRIVLPFFTPEVMIVNFGGEEEKYGIGMLLQLREAGISSEIFPDQAKMKKQLAYADAKKIPFVIIAGNDEITGGAVVLRNMTSGDQEKIETAALVQRLNMLIRKTS